MSKKKGAARHSSHSDHKNRTLHEFSAATQKLPIGVKMLVAYTGFIAFFYSIYLLFNVSNISSVFFGKFLYGTPAFILEFISVILLAVIMYGLVKKHYWVFWVSFGWFVFGAVNALVSLVRFSSEFDIIKNILVISSYVVILLNGIIAWYIYSEKEYFRVKHLNKVTKAKDKFFAYVISVFLIVSFLFLLTFGLKFYTSTIKTVDAVVLELKDSPIPELHCAKKSGEEKDICYLVLSIAQHSKDAALCDSIASDFYRMTCYRSLK